MRARLRNPFTTIKTAGLLLPIDLLTRIVDGDSHLSGLSPKDYHLHGSARLNEVTARAWNECQAAWRAFRQRFSRLPTSDAGTTVTRDEWLLPLFQELGYGRLQTKIALKIEDKEYPVSHGWENHVPIHLLSARYELDRRTPGVAGAATRSPYSMVQELLNRSAEHRWGFVSNGLKLFVLRDNLSLARAVNVEFDLEAMMDDEIYADFQLLFLLCHQSRVEIPADGKPEDCWLEKWSNLADEQGTRAREKLRDGVEATIKTLGAGFLETRGNTLLREKLREGTLTKEDYYRQLLRLVYRLLMLLVAEEKKTEDDSNLLHPPGTPPEARERYARFYSIGRLRTLANERRGTAHPDLYESLKVLFFKLREGYAPLGIPGLASFLFSNRSAPDIDQTNLSNEALLDAIRHLCITEDTSGRGGAVRRPVDFSNLGADELGSVYESLLELYPQIDTDEGPFTLMTAAGSERKTTGSYYTPTSLINCLLDSALDPVVEEALKQDDPEQALLNLKVCDPACGSGHFLIAAAERMAKHLASLRTGDDEPSTLEVQRAKRDIIGRCIYGVDLNPMAVELCKVSLWMEALEPGKPLSFLEHHIQCGNSLLGTTPKLLADGIPDGAFKAIDGDDKSVVSDLKKRNGQERKDYEQGQGYLFEPAFSLGSVPSEFVRLSDDPDDTLAAQQSKETRYVQLVEDTKYQNARLLADTWCAAFVWKKDRSDLGKLCPTERMFRSIEQNPRGLLLPVREEIARLRDEYQFFHWHLVFPDVFRLPTAGENTENEQMGWSGGFDLLLGNPPWEMPEVDDREFFATTHLKIANEPSAQQRQSMILSLANEDLKLHYSWQEHIRRYKGERIFFSSSGKYPCAGTGRLNYYKIFLEGGWNTVRMSGRLGMVIPSSLTTNAYERPLWHNFVRNRNVSSVIDFENNRGIFPSIDKRSKFSLLSLSQKAQHVFYTGCWLHDINEVRNPDRVVTLGVQELERFSPDELALPQFRSQKDLELLRDSIHENGCLSDHNNWSYTPRLMFSSSDKVFQPVPLEIVEVAKLTLQNRRIIDHCDSIIPVYEGKMVGIFDHRQADIYVNPSNPVRRAQERAIPDMEKIDPNRFATPQYWLRESAVRERRYSKTQGDWELVFCDVTSATNERTALACIIPLSGLTRNLPAIYLDTSSAQDAAVLVSTLSSFVLDFYARLKVASNHLTQGILATLPCPSLDIIRQFATTLGNDRWFEKRTVELTYTAWDLEFFARECGYDCPPFIWDEERRLLLRCELDAAYFHLYGIDRDDVDYIMETFPIVKRKDVQTYGAYRTKQVILEIYDELTEAIRTGQPYQTRLNPPPADPSLAHPPEESKLSETVSGCGQ